MSLVVIYSVISGAILCLKSPVHGDPTAKLSPSRGLENILVFNDAEHGKVSSPISHGFNFILCSQLSRSIFGRPSDDLLKIGVWKDDASNDAPIRVTANCIDMIQRRFLIGLNNLYEDLHIDIGSWGFAGILDSKRIGYGLSSDYLPRDLFISKFVDSGFGLKPSSLIYSHCLKLPISDDELIDGGHSQYPSEGSYNPVGQAACIPHLTKSFTNSHRWILFVLSCGLGCFGIFCLLAAFGQSGIWRILLGGAAALSLALVFALAHFTFG